MYPRWPLGDSNYGYGRGGRLSLEQIKPMSSETLKRDQHSILIKRLSHMALGVRDLDRQSDFYVHGCGLHIV